MSSWSSGLGAQFTEFGTEGYPPHVRRRLKILNVMAYLIAIFSLFYALTYARAGVQDYSWIIAINLALVVMGLSVPFLHRVHEVMGGMVIAVTECAALFGLVALLGRGSGIQLNLIIGAAAAFFILGLERLKLCGAHVVAGRSLMESIARCTAVNIFPWVTVPETNSPSLRIVKLGLPLSMMMISNV